MDNGWEKTPCLHLNEPAARTWCDRIFAYARTYGGAVTVLWHYENLVPPRDWSGFYADMVRQAKADGAWVTTAGEVAGWFRKRRETGIEYEVQERVLIIRIPGAGTGTNPPVRVRVHIDPARVRHVNSGYEAGNEYVDIPGTVSEIWVTLA